MYSKVIAALLRVLTSEGVDPKLAEDVGIEWSRALAEAAQSPEALRAARDALRDMAEEGDPLAAAALSAVDGEVGA